MLERLGDRFMRDKGAPQQVGEQLVHQIYRVRIKKGVTFKLCFESAKSNPVQGICIDLDRGELEIAGAEGTSSRRKVLWADTAPPEVVVRAASVRGDDAELGVWNCWRNEDGGRDAWLGDAGMLISETDRVVLLRCSDVRPGFSPSDLVVRLTLDGG